MRARLLLPAALILVCLLVPACGGEATSPETPAAQPLGRVELLGSLAHADSAWTEGLLVSEGILWESTGLQGKSAIRGLDKETGAVLWSVPNDPTVFGEGLVRAFGRTYVLTYKQGKVFLFQRDADPPYTQFAQYDGEGWGLTATDRWLVNSNGSSTLYYRDPDTFAIEKEVEIEYEGQPVPRLNELEFDGTYIWANQWRARYVYRVREDDPTQVVRFALPSELCPEGTPNGIAWDEEEDAFFLTGQACDHIWKVRFQ
jgi:glutamine cyclotransferase